MNSKRALLLTLQTLIIAVAASAADSEAPLLTSISISPSSVDVENSAAVITVTVGITDDESGFSFGNLRLFDGSGGFVRSELFDATDLVSGSSTNGTYEVAVTIPWYGPPGTWEVRPRLWDGLARVRSYGGADDPFPNPGDEAFTVTNAGQVDTTAPDVYGVSTNPLSIDIGSGPATVTATLDISDDLTGFSFGFVDVYEPDGTYRGDLSPYFDAAEQISGFSLDGTYEVDIEIPQGSPPGTWTYEPFVVDRLNNSSILVGDPAAQFVVLAGGGVTGEVDDATDATQYPHTLSGNADWFFQTNFTWDGVDAAQSGTVFDDESSTLGINLTGPGTLTYYWKVSSEADFDVLRAELAGDPFSSIEISGEVDWVQESLTIPPGPQTVLFTYAKDESFGEGLDTGWIDRVQFAADSDQELPTLQRIAISPDPVDMSSGDRQVTFTLEISDDFNGVLEAYISVYDPVSTFYFSEFIDAFNRVSGDAHYGTYEVTVDFFQSDFPGYFGEGFVEFGLWSVEVELVEDISFSSRFYGPGDNPFPNPGDETFLVSDGPVGDGIAPMLVQINSIIPDPVDVSAGPSPVTVEFELSDDSSGVDFGNVFLYNPDGNFVDSVFFSTTDLISGDALSGTYAVSVPVPDDSLPGTWSLQFSILDVAGNERYYPQDAAFPNPGDELFDVVNNGLVDVDGPTLQSITLSPDSIDTSGSGQTVNFTLEIEDDISGIAAVSLWVYDPAGTFISSLGSFFSLADLLSDTLNGTIEVPQGSTIGTWQVGVRLRDSVGNVRFYHSTGEPFPVPGEETFEVVPPPSSTYDTFVATYSLTGNDALPDANPDKDWLLNIFELLLGTNPTVVDVADPILLSHDLVGSDLVLVFRIGSSLVVTPNGNFLDVSDGVGAPIRVTGKVSDPLNPTSLIPTQPTSLSGSSYELRYTVSGPAGKGFIQLEALNP